MRVLVVEDERLLADTITAGLRNRAIAVDVAYDGDAALERLAVNDYDVIVLDRDLPVVSGDDVCRTLVESGAETRILMLTAATAVKERVAGLGRGPPRPPRSNAPASGSTPISAPSPATASPFRCPARSSPWSPSCCAPTAAWCRPSSCWRRPGTNTSTRSPVWFGSPS